jgi:hypothetical protein
MNNFTASKSWFIMGLSIPIFQSLAFKVSNQTVPFLSLISSAVVIAGILFFNRKIELRLFTIFFLFIASAAIPLSSRDLRIDSIVYFALLYLPILVNWEIEIRLNVAKGIVFGTAIGSILSVIQFFFQSNISWLSDPLRYFLPNAVIPGFNRSYRLLPFDIIKPNGVFFLEPSFLSLYCGLSLVLLYQFKLFNVRHTRYLTMIIAIGLVSSLAVTGMYLLFIYYASQFIGRNKDRISSVSQVILLAILTFAAGATSTLITRLFEFRFTESSFSLRLTQPYIVFKESFFQNEYFGRGIGTAYSDIELLSQVGKFGYFYVQRPTIVRLLLEVGLIGFLLFVILLLGTIVARNSFNSFGFLITFLYLIPTDAFLTPAIALLWIWLIGLKIKDSSPKSDQSYKPDREIKSLVGRPEETQL